MVGAELFIVQNDSQIVMRDFQPSVSTTRPPPVRTFTLPPLGFPPLPSVPSVASVGDLSTPDQVLTAALTSLPLWFLLGSEILPDTSSLVW